MSLTPDQVRTWLEDLGKTRAWLADEIGFSLGTLNNQFSSGKFPVWVEKAIRRMMADPQLPRLRMTFEQWDKIEKARQIAGYEAEDREAFIIDSLKKLADDLIAEEEARAKAKKDPPDDGPKK